MLEFLAQLWNNDSGQGLSEYALLVAAVVALSVAVAGVISGEAEALIGRIGAYISDNASKN